MKPDWTFDRPTEPGEYWLALRPEIRPEVHAELDVMPPPVMDVWGLGADAVLDGFWWEDHALEEEWLTGAQWAKRETPADPFAKTAPQVNAGKELAPA